MFCPSCGSENSEEQRFCRKCGLHLQTIAQVVAHQVNASRTQQALTNVAESKTIWHNPLLYGLLLLMLGIIVSAIGKSGLVNVQGIVDVGTILSMLGVVFFFMKGVFIFQRLRFSQAPPEIKKAGTTKELPHLLEEKEQPPSITDFTTRNFDTVYAERYDAETSNTNRKSDP